MPAAGYCNSLIFAVEKSSKSRLTGKLRYWWAWAVAAALLLFVATPALLFLWIINRRESLYPLALWGAKGVVARGYDADEVCALLALTPANQRVLLHRGRARIRAALAAYFEIAA